MFLFGCSDPAVAGHMHGHNANSEHTVLRQFIQEDRILQRNKQTYGLGLQCSWLEYHAIIPFRPANKKRGTDHRDTNLNFSYRRKKKGSLFMSKSTQSRSSTVPP
jgi:hypothetical protein